MTQQLTNILNEINTLYNRKKNIDELLHLINGTNIKQNDNEKITQLMKRLPTFENLKQLIVNNLISDEKKEEYSKNINSSYDDIDKSGLNKCEIYMLNSKYPYMSFLNKLKNLINGNNNHPYFYKYTHGKIKMYILCLITTVKTYCQLYDNYNSENIKEYNKNIQSSINLICKIEMINAVSNEIKVTNLGKYIYYGYNKSNNILLIRNKGLDNTFFISNPIFILNTIGLPNDYKNIIDEFANTKILPKIQSIIGITNSQIDIEIENENNNNAFFVLPSQLNGAEYGSYQKESIVKEIFQYKSDPTGGPRGQLALHHAVGQFIIDNAGNDENINGINCVKYLLKALETNTNNIKLINGYLQVPEKNIQAELFLENLDMMLVVGMENVPVKGYYYGRKNVEPTEGHIDKIHHVNVIYASAIPFETLLNFYKNDNNNLKNIANYVIIGQYYGALHSAYKKYTNTKIKVFLMPLGGGVFNNAFIDIFNNIVIAIKLLETKYSDVRDRLDIRILTYKDSWYNEYRSFNDFINNYKSL